MKRYEYKVASFWFWSTKRYEEEMNKLGREGWEMFFVVSAYHYFKREI
ncbi:MAG: hypothetical protein QMB51_02205 [Patescibacteria group bacterium]